MVFQKNLVMPGFLELYCGPMKSGKSRELINRIDGISYRNDADFIFFKPRTDRRNENVYSRFGDLSYDCNFIGGNSPENILDYIGEKHKIIAIDEIMLFDNNIVSIVKKLLKNDKNVIVAGLDLDFRGEPFGNFEGDMVMPELLCLANYVEKLSGICEYEGCNGMASRTQRLINDQPASYMDPLITIEGEDKDETYECRCLEHHFVPESP